MQRHIRSLQIQPRAVSYKQQQQQRVNFAYYTFHTFQLYKAGHVFIRGKQINKPSALWVTFPMGFAKDVRLMWTPGVNGVWTVMGWSCQAFKLPQRTQPTTEQHIGVPLSRGGTQTIY